MSTICVATEDLQKALTNVTKGLTLLSNAHQLHYLICMSTTVIIAQKVMLRRLAFRQTRPKHDSRTLTILLHCAAHHVTKHYGQAYLLYLCAWCCWPPWGFLVVFFGNQEDPTPCGVVDCGGEDS